MTIPRGQKPVPRANCQTTVEGNLSLLLDMFWLSAGIVLLSHSRAVFFVPWDQVQNKGVLTTAFYFVSGWGNYGVLIFFSISGFLIGGGVLDRMRMRSFRFSVYFLDRFSRIYIVLFPALLLVWAVDTVGLRWLNGSGIYSQEYPVGALPFDVRTVIGPIEFLSNLVMLQNVITPPFGTAQPLWSLSWEWWCYMIAPVSIAVLYRLKWERAIVVILTLGGILIAGGGHYVFLWHCGILLCLIRFRNRTMLLVGGFACLALPVITRSGVIAESIATQTAFALGFVALLSQLRFAGMPRWLKILPHQRLASFSYSLYILHTSFMVFVVACMQTFMDFPRQLQPTPGNYAIYLVLLVFVAAASFGFGTMTEYRTYLFRRWLRKRFLGDGSQGGRSGAQ